MEGLPVPDEEVALLMQRLERVARELVLEPASAQDLVQEAWLTVLRTGTPTVRHPLRWMKVVMRRRWMRQRARELLRRECEELAARVEATRDEDSVELASSAALVMSELTQLASPYRDVLRMRFLDERPIREIAEHFGSTPETVRSQVHRGLARLRERLDRRAGSRAVWAGMLLSATGLERQVGSAEPGGIELASRAPVATLGVLTLSLLAVTAAVARLIAKPAQPDSHARVEARPPSRAAATPRPMDLPETSREVIAAVATTAPTPPPGEVDPKSAVPPDVARLRLAVLDGEGAPIVDIDGDFFGRDRRLIFDGHLDPDGQAVIDVHEEDLIEDPRLGGGVVISMCAPGRAWSDTLAIELEVGKERSIEVVLDQPARTLTGHVINSDWEPVVGARVDASALPAETRVLEPGVSASPKMIQTEADEQGRFLIEGLPPKNHVLRVTANGYLERVTSLVPSAPDQESDLALELEASAVVEGVVSFAGGRPASGAVVWVATSFPTQHLQTPARCDTHGAYRLFGFPHETPTRVFACDEADSTLFAATTVVAPRGEVARFDAVLEATPGLRVRVLDASGSPAPGTMVVAAAQDPVSDWSARVVVDSEGRGVIQHVPDERLELRVYPTEFYGAGDPRAFRTGIRSSREEYVLTLGQQDQGVGELAGRILRANGQAPERATAYAALEGFADRDARPNGRVRFGQAGLRQASVSQNGLFLFQHLQPGRYEVFVLCEDLVGSGIVAGGVHLVLAAERAEVGLLPVPRPVRVRFTRPPEESPEHDVPLLIGTRLGPYTKSFMKLDAERVPEVDLFPGDYIVRFGKRGEARSFRVDGEGSLELMLRQP